MRVLVVCRSFPAHRAGGLEAHAQAIVEGLIAAGHRVSVVTAPLPRRAVVAPLCANGSITTVGRRADGRYDAAFARQLAPAVRRVVAREAIDIIHAQGFAGVLLGLAGRWGRPLGAPLVTTIHGTHWSETLLDRRAWARLDFADRVAALWRYRARAAAWPLWRAFLSARPRLIVDSAFTAAELHREAPRLPPPAIVPLGFVVEPPAVPSAAERHAAMRELMGLAGEAPAPRLLLALGRLEAIKGFDTLVAAARRLATDALPDWRLAIVGSGPDEERLRALVRRAGLEGRIAFLGRLDDAAKARALGAAHAVLIPDRGQPAFGLAVAEALVAGAPVLASRVGAHAEVLADAHDGVLLPAGRVGDWAAAMRAWVLRDEDPARRADRARRAAARFDRGVMIEALVDVYERVRVAER